MKELKTIQCDCTVHNSYFVSTCPKLTFRWCVSFICKIIFYIKCNVIIGVVLGMQCQVTQNVSQDRTNCTAFWIPVSLVCCKGY